MTGKQAMQVRMKTHYIGKIKVDNTEQLSWLFIPDGVHALVREVRGGQVLARFDWAYVDDELKQNFDWQVDPEALWFIRVVPAEEAAQ